MIWRFTPGWLVRFGQRAMLGYPASMRMTALPAARLAAVLTAHGGEVLDAVAHDDLAAHWRTTRYVLRRAAG
jgi:hypothetical protein